LQQALGDDGAKALKQGLYDAQKAGQTALTKQDAAKWMLNKAGWTGALSLAGYGVHNLFD
jgi:hypothetical protein